MKKIYSIGFTLLCAIGIGFIFSQQIEEVPAPETAISAADEAEYQRLSAQNAAAREAFSDLKNIAALGMTFIDVLPKELTLKDIKIAVQEPARAVAGILHNIAEIALKIIEILEERATMQTLGACLKYDDAELKSVAELVAKKKLTADLKKCAENKNPKAADICFKKFADMEKIPLERIRCPLFGCADKKACGARTAYMVTKKIQDIYDNVVVRFDIKEKKAYAGLLFNLDVIFSSLLDLLFQFLEKTKNPNATAKAKQFVQKIDAFKKGLASIGYVTSGLLWAIVGAITIIDKKAVSPAEMEKARELLQEAQTIDIPTGEEARKAFDDMAILAAGQAE